MNPIDTLPWHYCTASNGRCQCCLIWSIALDIPIACARRRNEVDELEPLTSDEIDVTRFIVETVNAAPKLEAQLAEARFLLGTAPEWRKYGTDIFSRDVEFESRRDAFLAATTVDK